MSKKKHSQNNIPGLNNSALGPINPETLMETPPFARQITVRTSSGPLPSPEELKKYQQIDPKAVEKMIEIWDREVAHRHNMETSSLRANVETNKALAESDRRKDASDLYKGIMVFLLLLVIVFMTFFTAIKTESNWLYVVCTLEVLAVIGFVFSERYTRKKQEDHTEDDSPNS